MSLDGYRNGSVLNILRYGNSDLVIGLAQEKKIILKGCPAFSLMVAEVSSMRPGK